MIKTSTPPLRRRLKLRDLELLVALDDTRNFNRAALLLHTSQPALSRNLSQLEAALGAALFERTSRGTQPTAYGERLIHHARTCLEILDRADDDLDAVQRGGIGHVAIGTNYSSAAYLLPHALQRLRRQAPGVSVTVREGPVDTLLDDLRTRRIDLVIARLGHQAYDADLATQRLYDEPMCLVCGPQHPLAGRGNLEWRDVLAYPWILPPRHTPVLERLGELLHELGLPWPESQVESASILVNTNLLRTSDVLSITPLAVARHQGSLRLVHQLAFELPTVFTPLGLITRRDHTPTSAQQQLTDCIRQELAEPSP
ncbi:MAG: LysR family transcriptional regulator [Pigmentiphaga sp.]|nr:LysR family transcriptional regulator [Pigmentiphaga sp.]